MALSGLFALLAATPITSNTFPPKEESKQFVDPELSVSVTSATSVLLEWDEFGSAGQYQVNVTNLSTLQVEQSFSTSNLFAAVTHLSPGVTYRFSVGRNGFVIAEDVVM